MLASTRKPTRPRRPARHAIGTARFAARRAGLRRGLVVVAACRRLQVVFVCTEVAPWSQVGGLADVAAALPAALAARGHRVMTVAPRYAAYGDVHDTGIRVPVQGPIDVAAASAAAAQRHAPKIPAAAAAAAAASQARPASTPAARPAAAATAAPPDASRDGPAAEDGEAEEEEEAQQAVGGEQQAPAAAADADALNAAAAAAGVTEVGFFWTHSQGVDRVFVDHPLFNPAAEDDRSPERVYTYRQGAVDLAASYSVLCQAALAAPVLLWEGGADALRPQGGDLSVAEQALLQQLLGGREVPASADWHWLQDHLQHPQTLLQGLAAPVLMQRGVPVAPPPSAAGGGGGAGSSAVLSRHDLVAALQQAASSSRGAGGGAAEDWPIVFVANDWPCGVLPLWLQAYQQQAEEEPAQQLAGSAAGGAGGGAGEGADPGLQPAERLAAAATAVATSAADVASVAIQRAAQNVLAATADCGVSVFNPQLSEAVEKLVASGRAAGLTPALIDAQAQLLELLELERTLGTCMHELRDHLQQQEQQGGAGEGAAPEQAAAPSAQGQDGEPEPAHAGGSDADSGTGASAPAAGSDAGSSGGASAAAGAGRRELRRRLLPQQLRTFQRMLGRQLAGSRVAFAIHNGRYEGRIDAGGSAFERLALPAALKAAVLAPAQAASAAVAGVGRVASALGSLLFGGPSPRQAEVSGVAAYDFLRAAELLGRQEAGGDALPEAAERLAQAQAPSTQQQPEQQPEQQQSQQQLRSRARQLLQQQQQAPRQQATTDARQEQAPSQPQQADQQPAPDARQEQPSHHHQQQQHLRLLGELEDQQPSPQADHPDHQQQQQPPLPEPEMNWLRAGVLGSDAVVTVSPSYAAELLDADPAASSAAVAEALAGREVVGMLNGLDERRWDPAGDPLLPRRVRFDAAGVAAGKAAAKQLLQQRLGLAVDPEVPVVAFLGRLEAQKGADIILGALPQLMGRPAALPGCSRMAGGDGGAGDSDGSGAPAAADASSDASGPPPPPSGRSMQLVMLGCGQQWVEEVIGQLPAMYPGRAAGIAAFNEPLAHLLLAGADYLLVPSRYEPCGLVALAALRYGALPIAAATGGLRDIVGEHNGYLLPNLGAEGCAADFRAAVAALAGGVARALAQHDSAAMHARRSAAMGEDVSWRRAVVQWEALLQRLADPAQPGEAGDGDDAEGASGGDGADRDGVSFGPAASSGGGRGRSSARGGKGAAAAAAALAVAPVEEQPLLRPAAATKSSR